jgi:tRNA(fMet)-specific endonuclease VapC
MPTYLLDTNICIYFLKGRHPVLRERVLQTDPKQICLSAVVEAELLFGLEKIKAPSSAYAALHKFLAQFASAPFDAKAASHYARVRASVEAAGTPIGPNDLIIAASALALSAVVVTNNVREFERVPGLQVEDWTV